MRRKSCYLMKTDHKCKSGWVSGDKFCSMPGDGCSKKLDPGLIHCPLCIGYAIMINCAIDLKQKKNLLEAKWEIFLWKLFTICEQNMLIK